MSIDVNAVRRFLKREAAAVKREATAVKREATAVKKTLRKLKAALKGHRPKKLPAPLQQRAGAGDGAAGAGGGVAAALAAMSALVHEGATVVMRMRRVRA
jgi:hypothetical protein